MNPPLCPLLLGASLILSRAALIEMIFMLNFLCEKHFLKKKAVQTAGGLSKTPLFLVLSPLLLKLSGEGKERHEHV